MVVGIESRMCQSLLVWGGCRTMPVVCIAKCCVWNIFQNCRTRLCKGYVAGGTDGHACVRLHLGWRDSLGMQEQEGAGEQWSHAATRMSCVCCVGVCSGFSPLGLLFLRVDTVDWAGHCRPGTRLPVAQCPRLLRPTQTKGPAPRPWPVCANHTSWCSGTCRPPATVRTAVHSGRNVCSHTPPLPWGSAMPHGPRSVQRHVGLDSS